MKKHFCCILRQQKKFQSGQSYSYVMRKVWYHQIWIETYLGFIVLILSNIKSGPLLLVLQPRPYVLNSSPPSYYGWIFLSYWLTKSNWCPVPWLWQLSCSRHAVGMWSGAVGRHLAGSCQAVSRQSSGSRQAVVRQPSGRLKNWALLFF